MHHSAVLPQRMRCVQSSITNESELLTWIYLTTADTPDIPVAASNPKHTIHGFDAELSLMLFDEDILHFRRFAKYVAAFWRMASSSSRSASCRLRRAFSRAEEVSVAVVYCVSCRAGIHTDWVHWQQRRQCVQ